MESGFILDTELAPKKDLYIVLFCFLILIFCGLDSMLHPHECPHFFHTFIHCFQSSSHLSPSLRVM